MSVPLTQLEIPDYDLGLRGKVMRTDKLDSDAGIAFCTIVHGLSVADEVTDTPSSGTFNGYPDAAVALDRSTLVDLTWRDGTSQAVIGDLVDAAGEPIQASPRGQVARLQGQYTEMGLTPVLGFEYELWIFDNNGNGLRAPVGRTENAYSLTRYHEIHCLAAEFINRMESIGSPVETFHSELGPGFFEFAMKPQAALKAADGAARARQYLKDLAFERGLRASFMAKPFIDRSGAGGHVHSSLTHDGVNVFASSPGRLSTIAEHYLAGLLATMGDFSALFNPFINSYRRLDKESFVAEEATWGVDDRRSALRILADTRPGARVEHRKPGADASPYLVSAAILAGGMLGITDELDLPAEPTGTPMPSTLEDAASRFEHSTAAKRMLGDGFVQGFATTRYAEAARFEAWQRSQITDWELDRYGGHL